MWNDLTSPAAIEKLLTDFGHFHDACLREISVATETYVAETLAMQCPPRLDTSVLLFFQRQVRTLSAIEIKCDEVIGLHLIPSAEGCDSIISGGAIATQPGALRLTVNFVGGSLTGPPNGAVFIPSRSYERPDLDVIARSIAWRPLESALGNSLRYRR